MKKKILFLPSWYPNLKSPYDGNFIQNHAKSIAIFEDVTVLFCTSLRELNTRYEVTHNSSSGLREVIVYFQYHSNYLIRFFRKWTAYRLGFQQIGNYDIIHSHVFFPIGFWAMLLSILKRKNIVHTEHSSYFHLLPFWKKNLFKLVQDHVSFYTPVSKDLKNTLLSLGIVESKISVIPNTIDIHHFRIIDGLKSNKTRFLHISAYQDPRKNVEGILNVFKALSCKYKDIELEIGGDGDMLWLQKKIADIDLKNIILKGKYSDTELVQTYNYATAFILFSQFENFGMVLAESIACGTPVIATCVGGVSDFVNEQNGILISPRDENALYEAMESFILNKKQYNSVDIRSTILDYVSYESVGKFYQDIYNKLN